MNEAKCGELWKKIQDGDIVVIDSVKGGWITFYYLNDPDFLVARSYGHFFMSFRQLENKIQE